MKKIKPSDLRIGNILRERQTGYPLVVCGITNDSITFDFSTNKNWQAEYVPLTEEILIKCGFVKKKKLYSSGFVYFLEGFSYCAEFTDSYSRCFDEMMFIMTRTPYDVQVLLDIEYLHTLQNLYYTLTGKELEIKL